MSGWSAFWLHLYFSPFLFLFTVIIITALVSKQLRSFRDNSRLVFHSFTTFYSFVLVFRVPLILGNGTLSYLLKIGFFFTGVLVFWFFGFKIYTWYFYLVLCVVIFLVFILAFFSAIAVAVLYCVHAL